MKKRLLALVMALAMCLSLLPVTAAAADSGEYKIRYIQTRDRNDRIYTTVGSIIGQVNGVLELPAEHDGHPVVDIGTEAFLGQTGMTGIILPETVEFIGDNAFGGCTALESIDLPGSLREIGESAFEGCTSLASVSLKPGIENCGYHCWTGTPWFENFPEGVSYQDGYLVCGKGNALGAVTVADGTHTILSRAMEGNTSLKSISFPSSLKHIGENAFNECYYLTGVEGLEYPVKLEKGAFCDTRLQGGLQLNPNLEEIPTYAFYNCLNLTEVKLPDKLKVIGESAFGHCVQLGRIFLPQGLEEIGRRAFHHNNLTAVTIPASVKVLGEQAFADNFELREIRAEGTPDVLGYQVFHGSTWVENQWDGAVYYDDWLIDFNGEVLPGDILDIKPGTDLMPQGYAQDMPELAGVTIPGSLTKIPRLAFQGCAKLEDVTMGYGVEKIDTQAFSDCKGLRTVIMPDTVMEMGLMPFSGCISLQEIRLSESLPTISYGAFQGCTQLENVHFSPYLEKVESMAFDRCGKLMSLDFGSKLKEIQWSAFGDCTSLQTIIFNGPAPTVGWKAFANVQAEVAYNAADPTWDAEMVFSQAEGSFTWRPQSPQGALSATEKMTTDGINLHWQAVPGADHYEIWASRDGKIPCIKLGETRELSFSLAQTIPGSDYRCHVQAIAPDGQRGVCSKVVTVTVEILAPELTGCVDPATNLPTLQWNSIPGIEKYQIHIVDYDEGDFQNFYVQDTSYVHETAIPGESYGYMVYAVNDEWQRSSASNLVELTVPQPRPDVRVSLSSSGKPVLRWTEIPGAYRYEVERKVGTEGDFTHLYTARGTSLTHGSAKPGETYYYRICTLAQDGTRGAWSKSISATCTLARPEVRVAPRSDGKPVLSWDKIDGAVKYEIYVSTNGGDFQRLTAVSGTKLNHTSAKSGNTYAYQVRTLAKNSDANSAWSETVEFEMGVRGLAMPTLTVTNKRTTGKPYLKWNKVEGAVAYEVCRATSKSGEYTYLWDGSSTALTNGSAKAGTTYYYKVRAIAADGTKSAWSEVKTRTCDLPCPNVTVKLRSGHPYLDWQTISGAVKYEVYCSVDGGSFQKLTTVSGSRLTHSSAKRGHTYRYKVRAIAKRSAANSNYSYYDTITVK